jgi:hypothetical protein
LNFSSLLFMAYSIWDPVFFFFILLSKTLVFCVLELS